MTDEHKTDESQEPQDPQEAKDRESDDVNETTTATADASDEEQPAEASADEEDQAEKLKQTIEINDVGPCKKHVKVTVDRVMIDERFRDKYREMGRDENVPGFRKGKAPLKMIMRRYRREVSDQVRSEVLMASLEQLSDETNLAPLSSPDIDPSKIDLPEEGDFIYEFEVEVRPEFDLPTYKGLKLKKPVYQVTDAEIEKDKRRLLTEYGQIVPKDGSAEIGDLIIADLAFRDGERSLGGSKEVSLRVENQLVFKDGVASKFGSQVGGVKAGEKRIVDVRLSSQTADAALRGKDVKLHLDVRDVKKIVLPELTDEFLEEEFGIANEALFNEVLQAAVRRRLDNQQRQSIRKQVLQHIAATADWELPEDLLLRQARRAMSRRIMEMRSDGVPEAEIQSRQRLLEQDILQSTALSLKDHFVMQRIAEEEKLEVDDDDVDDEIHRMAHQSDESPRRVRARLEKEDMLEALAVELLESKALDLILEHAVWEEVPMGEEEKPDDDSVATVEEQAVPGQMRDVEADLAEAEKKAASQEEEATD